MRFWETLQENHAWGTSLLLKSGMLGLGIVVVLWAGWPQPQTRNLDHSSAPIALSEDKRIPLVHHMMPVSSDSRSEPSKPSVEKGTGVNLHPDHVPMLVDLNGSSRMELEALPGIGMVLADRIVSYRSTYGGFQRVSDLVNVSGIGEKRLKRLEPFVTVEMIAGDIES
jgi:competence ComEA-like helix-hairpin-helix protein